MILGYNVVTNGTDNHIVLWDARNTGLSGSKIEKILEKCSISVNKNSVLGDISAVTPGGVRFGTPAMTTRGMKEIDMKEIAKYIDQITKVAQKVQSNLSSKKLDEFITYMDTNPDIQKEILKIKSDVENYASKFYIPGKRP